MRVQVSRELVGFTTAGAEEQRAQRFRNTQKLCALCLFAPLRQKSVLQKHVCHFLLAGTRVAVARVSQWIGGRSENKK